MSSFPRIRSFRTGFMLVFAAVAHAQWPTLLGKKTQCSSSYQYWEFHEQGGCKTLRQENLKLIQCVNRREPPPRTFPC